MKITDKVCCGITILIIFVYLGLMGASFAMGPMEHIAKPYDMNGQLCQGSYLYFLTPQQGFLFRTVCLSSCPKAKDSTLSCSSPNIKCTPNNSPTNPSEQVVIYDTDLYNNIACLPTDYKLFQIVMEGMNVPSLQLYASQLKGDYIGILFAAFASIFLGILFLKLQKSYSAIMIQIINIAYPIIITLVLLFLINSVSQFTKANVIDELGDRRPLINTSMALLLDSHFNKIYLVLLVLIFVIWLFIGLLDIKFNSISLQQVHLRNYIQLSFFKSIKYIYVPLTLSLLLSINFSVFYQSIISSIGIGEIINGTPFYQNSPVSLVFIGVQTILFIYLSILICVYGDTIMFVQSHINFENLNNQIRSHIVLECLSHLGSVSYFVLKLIIKLPIRWFVDFLYLINKIENAQKYEKELYSFNTTTIALVFIKERPLMEIMNNLGQYIENEAIAQSLYNSGCSFIYKNGFFFMNLLIFGQLMIGISICGAILNSLLVYQISYIYGVQFSKGACAMQLFKKEIQQEQLAEERGEVVTLNILMDWTCRKIGIDLLIKIMNIYDHNYVISPLAYFKDTKLEQKYRNSNYSASFLFPLVVAIHLQKNQEYYHIALMLISIVLWYRTKQKYRILVRILLHLSLIFVESHDYVLLSNSLANLIILPQWTYQIIFLFLTIRNPSQFYLVIFYSAISHSIELVKRNKFAQIYYASSIVQQQSTILTQLPHHILTIDEGLNIIYSNHGWKQLNFTKLSKRIIVDAIKKKQRKYLWLDHEDKITFEYLFKVQNNLFTLIQMQFANNQIELFDRLETQTNQLYHQLCQDYQKWNNLRVFKVIKESDLSILGQCTSDCRFLEHQLQTMDYLLQDLSFTRDYKIVDFYLKNYICNVIESMANKLFDHFTVVNLDFEIGVPELIKGNKNTLMYLLYTFLYSTTFDLKKPKQKIEEKELRISVCILRVNMEKSGYDLEFSIYYPCTPKLIQIYATFFGQGEYEPQSDKEQLLLYMMLKCKQLSQQNNQEIQFVTDGDSLTIRFSVSVTLISQQTQCNETLTNPQSINTMSDNILFVDLTFTKTISQTNHFQWKAKSQNPTNTVLPLKFDKALSDTSEKKEEQQQQQQQQQQEEDDGHQIQQQLLYPEFKEDVLLLLEDIIRQAYQEGLIDRESISITQKMEGKVGAYSEVAESEIQDSPTLCSPKLFKTPQMKPRKLQSLRKDMIKKQLENVNQKKPNQSKRSQPMKTKQLSVLFSPSVMSKFANNLSKISTQKYKNHFIQGSLNSLNEIDDSKNQSFSHYQMFGSQVFKNRMLAHKRYWSHHVQITDMPKVFPQILCYVPNTKLIEIAKRFGNTTYGQQILIREPLIVFEIHDAIKEYKKILEQGFQFYFILLYIQKQNEVIDFTNTIKANEKEIIKQFPNFKPTNIIGVSDKAQQLNLQFCANLNYIMSVNLNESQLKSSKVYIASIIDGNK